MLSPSLNMASALQVAVQYLAIFSLFANPASSFFPTIFRQRVAGNGGMFHEQMTNVMYDDRVKEYFPEIKVVNAGMTRARKTITTANIDVDSNETESSAAHFDAKSLVGGQLRLQRLFQEVVDRLEEDNAEAVQQVLGGALHTIQERSKVSRELRVH